MSQLTRGGAKLLLVVLAGCGGGGSVGGGTPPAAPSQLSVTSTTTARVALAWADNSSDEQGFVVERSTGAAAFTEVARPGAGVTSYQDTAAPANARQAYRVRAFGAGGLSPPSNEVTTTTYTAAGAAGIIQAFLVASRGDELPPSASAGSYLGVTYTVTFLGFAFCMPASPYADPTTTPTPPANGYGCQNAAAVSLSVTGATATLIVDVPDLYVDLSTQSTFTGTDPAYLQASGTRLTMPAALATTPDGRVQVQSVVGQSLTTTAVAFHSSDAVVNGLGFMTDLVMGQLQATLLDAMVQTLTANLELIPPFIP